MYNRYEIYVLFTKRKGKYLSHDIVFGGYVCAESDKIAYEKAKRKLNIIYGEIKMINTNIKCNEDTFKKFIGKRI